MKTFRKKTSIFLILPGLLLAIVSCSRSPQSMITEITLSDNWFLAPDSLLKADGKSITQSDFSSAAWVHAKVPSTVLGALADAGVYNDLYFGKNLEAVPRNSLASHGGTERNSR